MLPPLFPGGTSGGHFEPLTAVIIHEVLNIIVSLLSFLRKNVVEPHQESVGVWVVAKQRLLAAWKLSVLQIKKMAWRSISLLKTITLSNILCVVLRSSLAITKEMGLQSHIALLLILSPMRNAAVAREKLLILNGDFHSREQGCFD
jgi:hypothetical protein